MNKRSILATMIGVVCCLLSIALAAQDKESSKKPKKHPPKVEKQAGKDERKSKDEIHNKEIHDGENQYVWNDSLGRIRITDVRDARDNRIISAACKWDSIKQIWVGITNKTVAEYRMKENFPTMTSTYKWNTETDDWEPAYKEESQYNSNDKFVLGIWYEGRNREWIPANRTSRLYTISGQVSSDYWDDWDEASKDWIKKRKFEDIYDAQDRPAWHYGYVWDTTKHEWRMASKWEYKYDADGKGRTIIKLKWSNEAQDWVEYK